MLKITGFASLLGSGRCVIYELGTVSEWLTLAMGILDLPEPPKSTTKGFTSCHSLLGIDRSRTACLDLDRLQVCA